LAGAARSIISGIAPAPERSTDQNVWIDPSVMAATAMLLIAVVLVAAWLPARRAARIEPTLALKG
jgi:ABC-type lipoprotein release transport system permease subunit